MRTADKNNAGQASGRLAGSTALVTGASRGIGEAISLKLQGMGITPNIIVLRCDQPLEDRVDDLAEAQGDAGLGLVLVDVVQLVRERTLLEAAETIV